jgi:HSP20 family protein
MTGRRRDLDDLRGEIQELFADLWQVPGFTGIRHGFRPQCDCFRTDDPPVLHVVVELPGVDPATIAVAAAGRALTIGGTRERPTIPGARYHSMEIEYGAFQRRIDLGEDVDSARAVATYERGMLKVVLPVAEHSTDEESLPIEVTRR